MLLDLCSDVRFESMKKKNIFTMTIFPMELKNVEISSEKSLETNLDVDRSEDVTRVQSKVIEQ